MSHQTRQPSLRAVLLLVLAGLVVAVALELAAARSTSTPTSDGRCAYVPTDCWPHTN